MGYPIKKTVTVVWDGANWRDQETGVLVTGVLPPHPVVQGIASHPFDKSFTVTYEQVQKMIADAIEQYKEEESNSHYPYVTIDRVDSMIDKAAEKTIGLVTQLWNKEADDRQKLYNLYAKLATTPWWKRW